MLALTVAGMVSANINRMSAIRQRKVSLVSGNMGRHRLY